jgi:hypothetical protein
MPCYTLRIIHQPAPHSVTPGWAGRQGLLTRAENVFHYVLFLGYLKNEGSRYTLPCAECPGSVAISGRACDSRRNEEGRRRANVRRFAHGDRPLAAHRRAREHHLAEVQAARPTEGDTPGVAPGRHRGAVDHRPLPRPTQAALCAVDAGGGAAPWPSGSDWRCRSGPWAATWRSGA